MTVSVRQADISDLGEVERLDAICFQPSDPDHQPAAPGELRAGLQARQCLVAELNDVVVGYIAHDAPSPDHIYISALAVEPGHRESGVGGALLDHFLRSLSPTTLVTTSISTVTSPNNLPMLRLLCSRNFIVRRQLADYFEPGSKRFYCQLKTRHMFTDPDDRYLVPVGSIASIGHLLDDDAYVITDVLSMSWDAFVYEISRFDVDDIGSLQSDECAASISFQSAILAILTFLLGFAFASSNYPAGAWAVLVFATLASTISLIIYANASGDLSRLQNGDFQQYMKWGNLLSEFGGVQPFAVVLALTFANVASTDATGAVVAGGVGAALLLYEFSSFSYRDRYRRELRYTIAAIICAALPLAGVWTLDSETLTIAWTVVALAAFASRIIFYWPKTHTEAGQDHLGRRWRPRAG